MHLPDLIADLGFILITAAVTTLLFRKLHQPVVLGYLIAGFLLSSHVPIIPTVRDPESIRVWGEIGVIFLLFALGLEFSFKKLVQVGRAASVVAMVEVLFMMGLGYLIGNVFGWSDMDSLFLGGILAISSTTIIARAFEELDFKTKKFVSLVYGVLIVEDLFAILLLVLLSTVAATRTLSGSALAQTSFKLGFFMILWFVVGIYLLPLFLQKIRKQLNHETLLIVSIGLCLMMVLLATAAGFSPALGAFVMGSLLAETREGRAIEELIVPVKDLFAAIFFVSVGMLINPHVIYENLGIVVTITILTIVGKLFSTTLGALTAGQNLRDSVRSGLSLAQIGEFSFIIAGLGLSLGVTSDFLSPLAVAVSAITTFTTPYLIRFSGPFHTWLEKRLPQSFLASLDSYHAAASRRVGDSLPKLLWKLYGVKLLVNSVLIIAIALIVQQYVLPEMAHWEGLTEHAPLFALILTLFLCAPFFWPIVFGLPAKAVVNAGIHDRRTGAFQFGLTSLRFLVALTLFGFIAAQFSSVVAASALGFIVLAVLTIMLSRRAGSTYRFVERRFLSNLEDRHQTEKNRRPELAPWDASLSEFTLTSDSELAAKTLMESAIKERFGVTVALIERGQKQILAPGREDLLLPGDKIYLIGTEEQLEQARQIIEVTLPPPADADDRFGLDSMALGSKSAFLGRPIRDSGLRESIHGLIVGLEREGRRLLSPDSSLTLREGDLLWMVGDRLLMKELKFRERQNPG